MITKMRNVLIVFSFLLVSIFHMSEDTILLQEKDISEESAVLELMKYEGPTVLEEYIDLENKGYTNLIPYAVVLMEKVDDFSRDEIIQNMLRTDTLSEVESVLVEMLRLYKYDFSKLLFLQDKNTIELNTKQILLSSEDVSNYDLEQYIDDGTDFRARNAMQQLSFNDKELAVKKALELLDNKKISYYQLCAVNIAVNEYFRQFYYDNTYKDRIIGQLMYYYEITTNEQERYWIADCLGSIYSYELFKNILDNKDWDWFDKYVYFQRCSKAMEYFYNEHHNESDFGYYANKYAAIMSDDTIRSFINKAMTKSLPSSFKCYAVYRDGAFFGMTNHAAIMNLAKINGGANYASYPNSNDVIQATGYNSSISKKSWSAFLNGNSFLAACKPNNCSMTSTNVLNFHTKALSLIGISYTVVRQMHYNLLNDGSKIEPSQIVSMRCDGVVEYVYEYYGYRVGGGNADWDITINYTSNYQAHYGTNVTPTTQYLYLLSQVTTNQSDLY